MKNRVLLIGDAAAQLKPTSGGGLLIAFDCCKIASKYIIEAIENDDEKLSFWDKIYRVSYTHNIFGIYQETYLFNKKVHTVLICRYIYE